MIKKGFQDQYAKNLIKAKELFDLDLKKTKKNKNFFLKEKISYNHEQILASLLKETELLIFYGLGEGLFFLEGKKWLEENEKRKLIFLEDEIESLENFLHEDHAKDLLNHPQIKIYYLKEESFILKKLAWEHLFFKNPQFFSYKQTKEEKFLRLQAKISLHFDATKVLIANYSDFGEKNFQNLLKNLNQNASFLLVSSLKDKFKKVPALICGAGPSLTQGKKQLSLIKQFKDKFLVFAGGTALAILAKHKVVPHFGAHLDKDLSPQRFEEVNKLNLLYFLSLAMSSSNYAKLSAQERIILPSDGSYPLETYLYEQLKLSQPSFEIGWTVGTAMLALAVNLGCNPIIFTGLDFCFTQEKYPEEMPDEAKRNFEKIKDIYNREVLTQKDWLLAKQWIEDLVKENPHISFINANEGGLLIKGTSYEALVDLKEKYLSRDFFDLQFNSLEKVVIKKEITQKLFLEIKESIDHCLNLCQQKLANLETILKEKKVDCKVFEKEIFYVYHLLPLWNIFSFIINKEIVPEVPEEKEIAFFINKMIFFKNICEKFSQKTFHFE